MEKWPGQDWKRMHRMKDCMGSEGMIGGMIFALPFLLMLAACSEGVPAVPADALEVPCSVTDGDTIRCGEERIRLLAIDAPEMAGHCRVGRECVPGDPVASTRALAQAMLGRRLAIRRIGEDRYGRTLGVVYAGTVNLSCAQLEAGAAIYVRRWDDGGAVRAECPGAVRAAGEADAD